MNGASSFQARCLAAGLVLVALALASSGVLQAAWLRPGEAALGQVLPTLAGLLLLLGLGWHRELRPAFKDPAFLLGLGLGLAVLLQAGLALLQASTVVEGRRWFWLEDDAMVSMQYAWRLAHGQGLTWNDGPRVEGYSNFLWTLLMAGVHLAGATRASASAWMLGLNALCLVWLGLATARLARALGATPLAAALAALACALSFDQLAAALSGLEAVAVSALCAEVLARIAAARRDARAVPWQAFALAGLLPLLRADGALPAGLLCLLALWDERRPQAWALGLGLAFGPGLAHLAFRHAYYGAWVPNTLVLKSGSWPDKYYWGGVKTVKAVLRYPLVLLGVAAALRQAGRAPWLAYGAVLALYTVWTGHDYYAFHRFFAAAWPLFFALGFAGAEAALGARAWKGAALGAMLLAGWHAGLTLPWISDAGWAQGRERMLLGLELPKLVKPGQSVASCWAGALYYYSGVQGVDLLGKCDAVVARAQPDGVNPYPGHNKLDLGHSLGGLKPDWVLMDLPPYSEKDKAYVLADFDVRVATHPLFLQHCYGGGRQVAPHWAIFPCDWGGRPQ